MTSLFSPPMTPASATARSGVAMTVMSSVSARSSPSGVTQMLAVGGGAHDDVGAPVGAGHFREVEGMQRLAVEVQDVVRHVHDVVDGTAPGGGHALGEPFGRGPHLHVVDDPGGVARAARGIGHLNGDGAGHVLAGSDGGQLLHIGSQRPGHRLLVHGAHLAGHAHHRQTVRPVRRDLQVEHGISRAHEVRHGLADGRIFGQHPDAGVVLAEPQLAARAAHAAAYHAAQLRFLDLEIARQHRAHERHGHLDVRRDVRRPADDLHGFLGAHIHRHHVRVRSESGCGSQVSTCPTTTPSKVSPVFSTPSTPVPRQIEPVARTPSNPPAPPYTQKATSKILSY